MNPVRLIGRLGVAALTIALSACGEPEKAASSPPGLSVATAAPALLARGRAVYNFRCYFCHGYSGDSKTLAATYLTPPPRDFQAANAQTLPPERILKAVREGIAGTAMKPFVEVIPPNDVEAVAAFVFDEFVLKKAKNTRYHTPENGWPNHERYRVAYPFALGEVALTEPPESLSPELQQGRKLYLGSCISCHDRGKAVEDNTHWDSRPLSYPRNNYDHRNPTVDASTSATPYRLHDIAPPLKRPTAAQRRGEKLFQDNCAFCHAADGTGKNWIGAFLEPHPRNLTDPAFMSQIDRGYLKNAIREGVANTSMPAWKSVLSDAQIDDVLAYVDAAFHPIRSTGSAAK
jgi:cytochrome c oxidase cbb3-type subunit III